MIRFVLAGLLHFGFGRRKGSIHLFLFFKLILIRIDATLVPQGHVVRKVDPRRCSRDSDT